MTNQVKKVPELRFPEFDGKWEEKKLGDIAHITMGQSPKSSNYTNNDQDMVLVQGNADMKKGQIYPRIYTTEITKLAEIDDILLSVRAPVGELAIAQLRACIGRGVCAINANKFVYYNLELFKVRNTWKLFSQGSTFESISGNEIKKINFQIPISKSEQQKIGEFFSKLDRQIELEEQKLAKLEEQKKGYMQKLFSQELRFKTKDNVYHSEWQLHKLGEIFKYSQGKQISVDKQFSVKSNEMKRFIRIVDITENPEPRFVLYESDTGLVNKEDLFMIRYGRPGIVSIGFEGIIANNLFKLIPKIKISTVYFYYLLSYNYYRINLLTNQSTMPALNFKSLDLLKFKIPSYKEQNKIGNFFTKFDELIEKQNKKIDGLKKRKKGFLQKMFV